jgi:hypothetical protein
VKTSRLVREYNAAMKRIRAPALDVLCRKARRSRINPASPLAREVLRVATRLYKPDEVASPLEIARKVGCSRQNISSIIAALRRRELWPFRGGRRGLRYNKSNGYSSTTRT